ncbi:uncharacterized protein [Populus alba]|uniref:uncharacterized protein n=1 Tax=Populus alba TaxID=43335 RepID=UPI003CC70FEF
MAKVVHDEKLLIHFFQDNLSDAALAWYMHLDNTKIKGWKDLVDAFIKQYKFNMDVALDRSSLQAMEKGNKESIREYAQRWREAAAQVNPPLLEREMTGLFSNTFKAPYFEYLVGSAAQNFSDLVFIAERIEHAIQAGRIVDLIEKRGFVGRKKESEIHNVERGGRGRKVYQDNYNFKTVTPTPSISKIKFASPTHNQNNPINNPSNNTYRPRRNFSEEQVQLPPLPLTLAEMHKRLLSIGQISLVPLPPLQPPFPAWYKRSGGVNSLEVGKEGKTILKVTMDSLYEMLKQAGPSPTLAFNAEVGGLTRSGRCFTLEELENHKKDKGKNVVETEEVNKPVSDEEANEFLKLMRHSEYGMVLNEAYVPQDIIYDSIEHLVGRIQATIYLFFTDDELDPEGAGHNKPLYITVKCKDCVIAKVLIDNGSSLNVLPRHVLDKMPIDASHMKPSTMTARAYDGSPRPIIGNIDVELVIGPWPFQLTLQVMDIHPSYSILLGRPWIHAARAVTSSLHQRLKFIINGNLVIVKAKETLSMTRNISIPYIEAEGSTYGNLHAFEVVNAEQYDPTTGMPERINVIKMKCADQRFGLGFKTRKADFKRAIESKRRRRLVSKEFSGATIHYLEGTNEQEPQGDFEDEESPFKALPQLTVGALEDDPSGFVRELVDGEKLNNWETMEVPIVFKKKSESGLSINSQTHYTENNWPKFDETIIVMDEEEFREEDLKKFTKLVEQSEHTWKPAKEELELINVGTKLDKRELKIGKLIAADIRTKLIILLQEYVDVFTWSYADMPSLDSDIVVHKLPLIEGCKPIKKKLRRTGPDILIKVKEEITKQWDVGFLEVVDYSQWVSNIVVVPKKNDKIRVCVDFRDLNKASPKDDFPLPHKDVLVDNTAKSSTYSFMDGFSGYNQIKMAEQDKKKTTFVTPYGTY